MSDSSDGEEEHKSYGDGGDILNKLHGKEIIETSGVGRSSFIIYLFSFSKFLDFIPFWPFLD